LLRLAGVFYRTHEGTLPWVTCQILLKRRQTGNGGSRRVAAAARLGIGGELIPRTAIEQRQEHRIGELTRRFLAIVKAARMPPESRPYTV
jgi:hypothetical protein